MAKKAAKKDKRERTFKESHVLVVLEKMGDDIKLLAESQMGFRNEMIEFKDEMLGFKDEMLSFKDEMTVFKNEMIGKVNTLLEFKENAEGDIKISLEYLKRLDDELQDIKSEIFDAKNREKATDSWREMMGKRISEIEKVLQKQKLAVAGN